MWSDNLSSRPDDSASSMVAGKTMENDRGRSSRLPWSISSIFSCINFNPAINKEENKHNSPLVIFSINTVTVWTIRYMNKKHNVLRPLLKIAICSIFVVRRWYHKHLDFHGVPSSMLKQFSMYFLLDDKYGSSAVWG